MTLLLSNLATSALAAGIGTGDTTITVEAGDGAKFPVPNASGDWFPLLLVAGTGLIEIVRCTARFGDTLTIARAQEGTTAKAFVAGDRVDLRMTAAGFATFAENDHTLVVRSPLPDGSDLNSYAETGIYIQSFNAGAASGTNYPVATAGCLTVARSADGEHVYQEYRAFQSSRTFRRARYISTWSPWRETWDEANFDPASKQAAHELLTALSGLNATAGFIVQTGATTFSKRTLSGTSNEVAVSNGNGSSGNPVISLPNSLQFAGKTVAGGTFSGPTIVSGVMRGTLGVGAPDYANVTALDISSTAQDIGFYHSGGLGQARIRAQFGTMQFDADLGNSQSGSGYDWRIDNSTRLTLLFSVLHPAQDLGLDLGSVSRRYNVVFAGNGTISTSDEREKEGFETFTQGEIDVSAALADSILFYRWKRDAGNGKRTAGVTVQRVIKVFTDAGLDPDDYGFIHYDEWSDEFRDVIDPETGEVSRERVVEAGNRYSIDYDALSMFIIYGLNQRLKNLEDPA